MSGLEVIGSIASVAQLAGAVYSISIQLYEVANALSNAPADIKDLAYDLEIFSEELLLHSKLVNANNSRYSDQINRLTAKIIGRCAIICEKINKILKKLRSGSMIARLKWMYKEREIRKLLGRLRDLKLSLMGTLSLLRTLKADHMMDALGVQAPSLLDGPEDKNLSRETMKEMENTRRKLESITMDKCKPFSLSGTTLTPQTSWNSREMDETTGEKEQQREGGFRIFSSMSVQSGAVSRIVEQASTVPLMSAVALPGINTIMKNLDALESVQSFHSAVSHQENSFENAQDTTWRLQSVESRVIPSNYLTEAGPSATSSAKGAPHSIHGATVPVPVWPLHDASSKPYATNRDNERDATLNSDCYRSWQKDIAEVTARHFNMAPKDAESLACSIQIPSIKNVPLASVDSIQSGRNQIRNQVEPRRANGQYTPPQILHPFVVIREGGVWQSGNQTLDRSRTSTMQGSYDSTSPLTNHFPKSIPIAGDPVPPPLPPPRHLADIADGGSNGPDIGWAWGNSHVNDSDWGQPIAPTPPGSSLYGGFVRSRNLDDKPEFPRRGSSTSTIKSTSAANVRENAYPKIDEGYASLPRTNNGPDTAWKWSHLHSSADMAEFSNEPPSVRIRPSSDFYGTERGQAQEGSAYLQGMLAPLKYPFVKPQSIFIPIDESPSIFSRHYQQSASSPMGPIPRKLKRQRSRSRPLAVDFKEAGYTSLPGTNLNHIGKRPALKAQIPEEVTDNEGSNYSRAGHESQTSPSLSALLSAGMSIASQSNVYDSTPKFQARQPTAMQMLSGVTAPYFPNEPTSAVGAPGLQHHASSGPQNPFGLFPPYTGTPSACNNPIDTPVSVDVTDWSFDSLGTDDEKISKFLKLLDDKKTLQSFQGQASTKTTSARLAKLRSMRKSNNALAESISSSAMLQRSSSSSNRQLSIVPPIVDEIPISSSSSPSPPAIPCYPRKPSIPSHLSANSIAEYSEPRRLGYRSRKTVPPALYEDEDTMDDDDCYSNDANRPGTNAIEIPTSLEGSLPSDMGSDEQPKLWWRAFTELQKEIPETQLHKAWVDAHLKTDALGDIIAHTAINNLFTALEGTTTGLVKHFSPLMLESVQQILGIAKIVQSTLDFKTGGFIWTCLSNAITTCLHGGPVNMLERGRVFAQLAEIATLVARYNVMESMYHQWPGMTLHKDYEASLINLCIEVLRYLDTVYPHNIKTANPSSPVILAPENLEERVNGFVAQYTPSTQAMILQKIMQDINKADTACRRFSVTIVQDVLQRTLDELQEDDSDSDDTVEIQQCGVKRRIKDISDIEDDSDGTLVGTQEATAVKELPRAKRVKI